MATLPIPKGITPATVTNIPEEWSAEWFRSFIKNHLQYADVRNTIAGANVTVAGSPTTNATITATGGGTPGPNSITNAMLVQGPGLSVKGNPTNATANEQDITASAAYQTLQVNPAGTALQWSSPFTSGAQQRGATWTNASGLAILASGARDAVLYIPADCTIQDVTVLTKGGTGSCSIDIWASPYPTYPTVSNSIVGGNYPAIVSGTAMHDATLSGWNTTLSHGTIVNFHVRSTSVFFEIVIMLTLVPQTAVAPSGYTNAQAIAAASGATVATATINWTGSTSTQIEANVVDLGSSLGASGYCTISPSGLIMQWGSFAAPSAGATTVTFPHAFSTACYVVVNSQGQSTSYGYPFSVASKSTTGFVTDAAAVGGIVAGTCYYIALGK